MAENKIVTIAEKFCSFRRTTYTHEAARKRIRGQDKKDFCPVCRKAIEPICEIYMLFNNYKLFPNCMVHADCVEKYGAQVVTEALMYDFAEYQQMLLKFVAWI